MSEGLEHCLQNLGLYRMSTFIENTDNSAHPRTPANLAIRLDGRVRTEADWAKA